MVRSGSRGATSGRTGWRGRSRPRRGSSPSIGSPICWNRWIISMGTTAAAKATLSLSGTPGPLSRSGSMPATAHRPAAEGAGHRRHVADVPRGGGVAGADDRRAGDMHAESGHCAIPRRIGLPRRAEARTMRPAGADRTPSGWRRPQVVSTHSGHDRQPTRLASPALPEANRRQRFAPPTPPGAPAPIAGTRRNDGRHSAPGAEIKSVGGNLRILQTLGCLGPVLRTVPALALRGRTATDHILAFVTARTLPTLRRTAAVECRHSRRLVERGARRL